MSGYEIIMQLKARREELHNLPFFNLTDEEEEKITKRRHELYIEIAKLEEAYLKS